MKGPNSNFGKSFPSVTLFKLNSPLILVHTNIMLLLNNA